MRTNIALRLRKSIDDNNYEVTKKYSLHALNI